ncbi:uncharacterized protein LOC101856339 [Aplysia californica]|uniref:Uncharacterized protein LOC101856339 n=1 Tax=Aplysia californica TaxID=6500 RepID=A0ABM1VS53_APLCA|nr:uncharacterized protein LOC101856339 [Aplysia californica]
MGAGASTKSRPTTGASSKAAFGDDETAVPNYHKSQAPPPPAPPASRKNETFNEDEYKYVDDHVMKIPSDLNYGTFKDLVKYLTSDPEWSDLARVRSIFRWVTSVDVFSLQVRMDTLWHDPPKNFKLTLTSNSFCSRMAGIPCVILSGMNKSAAYEIGKKADRQAMGAQWNAVYVQDNWRFIDAFWACACVVGKKSGEWTLVDSDGDIMEEEDDETEGETQHRINEFYFMPDPDQFIWTHFPDDTKWQLLKTPVTIQMFQEHFYIRERFHILGMSEIPATKIPCVAETVNGEVEFSFGLPPAHSSTYRYKYMLYRSRSASAESRVDVFLDRFVLFEQQEDTLRFALRFPVKGDFKLDIYGLDIQDGDVFDLCCTYIINCPKAKPNCLPLPDCPPIGWGPAPETKAAGLKPITHKQAEVTSRDGFVEIRLAKERALAFHQLLRHSIIDEATLSKYSVTELDNNEAIVYLRLPQKGEYALKLFAQDLEEEGAAPNVLNYLINCSNSDTGSKPFPNVTNGLLGRNEMTSKVFGVKATSHPDGMIETSDGKLTATFEANPDVELVCEMHTNDGVAARKMKKVVSNDGTKWTFDLDMPVKGEYSLNVFARKKGDTGQISSVYTYLIKSAGREDGAGDSGSTDGEEEVDTSVPTETVETSDGEVLIPVPPGCEKAVAAIHRRNGNDMPDPSQIEFISSEGMKFAKVQLKDYGEYMLNLYSVDENGNEVKNVAKYQINRKRPGELYQGNLQTIMEDMKLSRQATMAAPDSAGGKADSEGGLLMLCFVPFPRKYKGAWRSKSLFLVCSIAHSFFYFSTEEKRKRARQNVHNAIELKDARHLEDAIKKFLDSGADENDPLLVKARQQLEILKAKAALMDASQIRTISALEKAIEAAKAVNTNHELDLQIALAARLKEHLAKIEKLRHSVLNMESKTISEIKSYSKPPDGVHQCMMATFLLLGHQHKDVKEWQKVQSLLGKTGKESVMRKISNFDAQTVMLKQAQIAKKVLQPYTREQIRDVSAGAATFYIWAIGMIEEVESYGGAERSDQMRLKK